MIQRLKRLQLLSRLMLGLEANCMKCLKNIAVVGMVFSGIVFSNTALSDSTAVAVKTHVDVHTTGGKMTADATASTQAGTQNTGALFLAENANKKGIHVLDNGLQYSIEQPGSGAPPHLTDTVQVMYEGRLIDGTVFDSSYARKQPAEFRVDQVIAGWQAALQKMSPGAKWILYIPSDLAYGARGVPGAIPPNSVLVFTVELLKIQTASS